LAAKKLANKAKKTTALATTGKSSKSHRDRPRKNSDPRVKPEYRYVKEGKTQQADFDKKDYAALKKELKAYADATTDKAKNKAGQDLGVAAADRYMKRKFGVEPTY